MSFNNNEAAGTCPSENNLCPPLPEWIPLAAQQPYAIVQRNGGYSDERQARALETLYRSPHLKALWSGGLGCVQLTQDGWMDLINSIIRALECAPPPGIKRATAERPATKHHIHARQRAADQRLVLIEKKAGELADLLADLEDIGAKVPPETYSSIALLRTALDDGMAHATCAATFENFARSLSSYAKDYFPRPRELVEYLRDACGAWPASTDLFADDPWLDSNQASWKDYLRVVKKSLRDIAVIYQIDPPEFTLTEWTALCKTLLELPELSAQTVAVGLKEL